MRNEQLTFLYYTTESFCSGSKKPTQISCFDDFMISSLFIFFLRWILFIGRGWRTLGKLEEMNGLPGDLDMWEGTGRKGQVRLGRIVVTCVDSLIIHPTTGLRD